MKRLGLLIVFICLLAGVAYAIVPLCAITGTVLKPDSTPCASCTITFTPTGSVPQIISGIPYYPTTVFTTTDASGVMTAISLIQGANMTVTITDSNGQVSAPVQTGVAMNSGETIAQLLSNNLLSPGVSTVSGFSVGTKTITAASSPYTVLVTDFFIDCDATSGNVIINLPASSGGGRWLHIEKIDSSANTCTVTASGADTIEGVSSFALRSQFEGNYYTDSELTKWVTGRRVTNLQNKPICTTAPSNADEMTYNSSTGQWCGAPEASPSPTPVPARTLFTGSCKGADDTISCTGNGTTTLTCSGGTGDFKKDDGVYIPNGSTTACTINGSPCPTPAAPTVGVVMSSRLQACTDVTVTANDGTGKGQYVSTALCDFSFLQAGDVVWVSGASAAGDNGYFTVSSATATTLKFTVTVTGEVAGSAINFQTMVPVAGGDIKIGNEVDDVGVVLDPDQRPFNEITTTPAYGSYNKSVVANVGTYTFDAADGGKPVTIYYRTLTPPTGATQYCFKTVLRDGIQGGYSPASAAACVTTATLTLPNSLHGMPFLYAMPAAVAGAYAYDMFESDVGGGYYWATRVWPNTTYVNTAVTLPQATIFVGSLLGFPTSNTVNIGGQTVTCTGVDVQKVGTGNLIGCSGGAGTFGLGTPVISTTTPKLHVQYGGGLSFGQNAWTSENFPLGTVAPSVQGNDDVSPTAPPTISALPTATTMTLSSPVGTGTFTVYHTDQNVWKAIWAADAASGSQGDTIQVPPNCTTRFCQMPFDPTLQISGIWTIDGAANQLSGTELQSYCDGGGQFGLNGVETATGGLTIGAIGNPGHLYLNNLAITSTNSALPVIQNSSNQFFSELKMSNVSMAANATGATTLIKRTGNTHTIAIGSRLQTMFLKNLVTRYVDAVAYIAGGTNDWALQDGGSLNTAYSGKLWHPYIGYAGHSFNGTIQNIVAEIPWTFLRPLDGDVANSTSDFTMINNFLGDLGSWGGANAPSRGWVIDFSGSGGQFIGGFDGQTTEAGISGIYVNASSAGNNAVLLNMTISLGSAGVLVDSGADALIQAVQILSVPTLATGIECRGNCTIADTTETVLFGASNTTAFKMGYKGDETTCNATSSTDTNYSNNSLTSFTKAVDVCSTARLAVITNDAGTQVLQGTKPTVTSCGTGSPSVANGSSNIAGSLTTGTGDPAACTLTFATAAQGVQTGTPTCIFRDQTALPMSISITSQAAAPTANAVLGLAAVGAGNTNSHVVSWHCDWRN